MFKTRLASIPHDRGQKPEIGRGQRAPVHRHDTGRLARQSRGRVGRAVVGIAYADHLELHAVWKRDANSDQTFVSQQLVGLAPVLERSDLGGRASGTVNQTKERLGAGAGVEAGLSPRRADGPAVLRLMAGEACASVAADVLEERIRGGMR